MIKVEVVKRVKADVPQGWLGGIARAVFKGEGIREAAVFVALVGPSEARFLNENYRRQSYVANVLAFRAKMAEWPRVSEEKNWRGEILLCPAAIKREAKALRAPFRRHLAYCFVHGLLHLLGYSHGDRMRHKERQYLHPHK